MIVENVTKAELSEALLAVHRLKISKHISDRVADIMFRCISVVSDLQSFGEENEKMEPVKYPKGKEPDCNLCGDYERCAFDMKNCTGFIPSSDAVSAAVNDIVKVPTIKMVPKEGAHIIPQPSNLADEYLSGRVKPFI